MLLFIYVLADLLAILHNKSQADLAKIFRECCTLPSLEVIRFRWCCHLAITVKINIVFFLEAVFNCLRSLSVTVDILCDDCLM